MVAKFSRRGAKQWGRREDNNPKKHTLKSQTRSLQHLPPQVAHTHSFAVLYVLTVFSDHVKLLYRMRCPPERRLVWMDTRCKMSTSLSLGKSFLKFLDEHSNDARVGFALSPVQRRMARHTHVPVTVMCVMATGDNVMDRTQKISLTPTII